MSVQMAERNETAIVTLRQMRDAAGLTAEEAAPLIAKALGRPSYHFSSVLKAEANGLQNIALLRAYANVYGRSLEEIEQAARPS